MAGDERLVVGAAIVRDGRVLAARRTRPASAAGRWELPGGKVEPGEDPAAALVREIGEELGCVISVERWLPGRTRISDDLVLAVAVATLVTGEPSPVEHDAVRWLGAGELDDVDWLDSDRPFLVALRTSLAESAARLRAVFFDEDGARAAAAALHAAGFAAEVVRERYAGEDDDEDHPWAVTTDAPMLILDPLVDQYDGWLDEASPSTAAPVVPLDLPSAPKRLHRPT